MENQKEIYRLWYEYLKRSDDYKEYCEWKWAKYEDPLLPNPDKPKVTKETDKYNITEETIPNPCAVIYHYFRDVHTIDFDEWWQLKKENISIFDIRERIPGLIEDYTEGWLLRDLNGCIDLFIHKNHREPSAIELRDSFISFMKKYTLRNGFLLLVDVEHESKHVNAEFKKFMNSAKVKRKMAEARPDRWDVYRYHRPTGKPREDIQKYLEVYDMWKDKVKNRKPGDPSGWGEIIKHFEPHRDHGDESARRLYQSYKKKAETIISNVERGFFPGKY